MTRSLREKLGALGTTLTHAGEEQPLHKAALAVVVLLDVFILVSIFDGLDVHTRQLATPSERVPPLCRAMVIDGGWTPANRLDRLAGEVASRSRGYAPYEAPRHRPVPPCTRVLDPVDAIAAQEALARAFVERGKLERELRDADAELERLKGAYDTRMLETLARRGAGGPEVEAIRTGVHEKTLALESARAQLAALDERLRKAEPVVALFGRLDAVDEAEGRALAAEVRRLERWYPVKRLGMELVFLLPLVAAFYAWSAASVRKRRGL